MKFERPNSNIVPFGTNANENKRFAFGTNNYTNDINENLNDSFKLGWETVGINSKPPRQWFNGLAYAATYLTSYLFQTGIPEWNENQEYYINSITKGSDGKIYRSLVGTEESPNVNNNPTLLGSESWKSILSDCVKLSGNQDIDDVKTFLKSPIVPTPTTDFQATPARSTNITVNVGAGQTYTTINQALEYLSGFYPLYKKSGITATINLKAGFVMNEQVLVSGLDLGWITIVGEDAETIITHTALTTAFKTVYPVFGVDKGGTSPVIGQLFRFNVEKVGGNKHGIYVYGAGSSANMLGGKGFIGAGTHGICAIDGSTINAYGVNASNAGDYGIVASNGSTINAYGANASNAGANGIIATTASTINAYGANASNAGNFGIVASNGSTINAYGANASNSKTYGIFADQGSTINAYNAVIQNQTTGPARVMVSRGSRIDASDINTTGGTVPALSQTANTLTGSGIIHQ
ncbi:right-handed parallel beta-helix repeat-containing protein [Aliarcobacter butzleri]|uniref:right-handed parallel beta-helix repeat-containing protein n=1 Tax=Aliarcobacter butzleri TaxID=28197 RepID=UPI0021B35764|nr:right-handed parallel beta-helix repeat-containing protein [Aliarcobacter butzleri]MCT7551998.1 right-handed parallel beta-helix repeat-containing protein [Aliarcobacter butzleri]